MITIERNLIGLLCKSFKSFTSFTKTEQLHERKLVNSIFHRFYFVLSFHLLFYSFGIQILVHCPREKQSKYYCFVHRFFLDSTPLLRGSSRARPGLRRNTWLPSSEMVPLFLIPQSHFTRTKCNEAIKSHVPMSANVEPVT